MNYYDILKKTSDPDKKPAPQVYYNKLYNDYLMMDLIVLKLSEKCKENDISVNNALPWFVNELINQINLIIDDHRLNDGYIHSMFKLSQEPYLYPNANSEFYSMSHLHNSDLRTCTQTFTLYMRAKGAYLYFLHTNNGRPVSVRFRLDDIKRHFKENNDPQNSKLFSELFMLVKKFIETFCEEDWYTIYLYLLYKHNDDEKYYSVLYSFPHLIKAKEYTAEIIRRNSSHDNLVNLGIPTLRLLTYLKEHRANTLPVVYNLTTPSLSCDNTFSFLYYNAPAIYMQGKVIGYNSACLENDLQRKLSVAERENYDRMYKKLSDFMKMVCNNIRRNSAASRAFIPIKILYENSRYKTVNLRDNDNEADTDMLSNAADILSNQLNEYPSENVCNFFKDVIDNNFYKLNNLSTAVAMCLTPENLLKKIIVINCGSNTRPAAILIKRILSRNKYSILPSFISHTDVKEISDKINMIHLNNLKKADTGGLKNLILTRCGEINEKEGRLLSEIAKQVNSQIIVLQSDDRVDFYKQDSYIYLDFSRTASIYLTPSDINWIRLYLGLYGLHCLNAKDPLYEEIRGIFSEQKNMPSHDNLRSVTEQFIKEYFVSTEEAELRKKLRLKLIYQLRCEYKSSAEKDGLITEQLSSVPLYATYKEDFLKYAEHYIKRTGITGISPENIFKQAKADKRFSYGEIKASYTGRKNGYGFQNLSLIKPFEESVTVTETPAQDKTITVLNTIVRELDLKEKLR